MRVGVAIRVDHASRRDPRRDRPGAGADCREISRARIEHPRLHHTADRGRMTTTKTYDVTAIGNAIVDVIAQADDALLAAHGLPKGAMNLIDAAMADTLYGVMGAGKEASGGSAGNTIAGIAMLGGKAAYIGKVADDQLGKIFTHDIRAVGVTYDTAPLQGGLPTARSLIFVTPDAQRTMQTFLGACTQLGPEDINLGHITSSKVVYMERSEERRVGKSVDLGGRRIIKKKKKKQRSKYR